MLGAVFAAHVGQTGTGTLGLTHAGRVELIAGVHTVFLVAAPLALIALLAVVAIKAVPLRGPGDAAHPSEPGPRPSGRSPSRDSALAGRRLELV